MSFQDHKLQVENEVSEFLDKKLEPIARFFENERNNLGESISDDISQILKNLKINYKFVISTFIMEKSPVGFLMTGRMVWDPKTDGQIRIEKQSGKNICLVSIWAMTPKAPDKSA